MVTRPLVLAMLLTAAFMLSAGLLLARWSPNLNRVAVVGQIDDRQREEVYRALTQGHREIERIADIRRTLTAIEWVHHVEITRRWPDKLIVQVVEETPIAYWNDDAFINAEGRVFRSPFTRLSDLAQLYGPEGTEREVMRQYRALANALMRINQGVETLTLDERGAWEFESSDGVVVMLGKDNILERIQRFLLVVERVGLDARMDDIKQVDTRYPNGVAVSWSEMPQGLAMANSDAYPEKSKRETRL